jgi:hypothetical protein
MPVAIDRCCGFLYQKRSAIDWIQIRFNWSRLDDTLFLALRSHLSLKSMARIPIHLDGCAPLSYLVIYGDESNIQDSPRLAGTIRPGGSESEMRRIVRESNRGR